jgi:hypothetical protein
MMVSLGSSHRQNRIRRASGLNSLTRWLWLQQARTATTGARHWHFVVSERLHNVEFMYLKIGNSEGERNCEEKGGDENCRQVRRCWLLIHVTPFFVTARQAISLSSNSL